MRKIGLIAETGSAAAADLLLVDLEGVSVLHVELFTHPKSVI